MIAKEPKKIKVPPGSELARLLAEAGDTPVILETNGELYRLVHMDKEREGIWVNYDPKKVVEGLRKSAGALVGVDRNTLLKDIHRQRQQASRGRPA